MTDEPTFSDSTRNYPTAAELRAEFPPNGLALDEFEAGRRSVLDSEEMRKRWVVERLISYSNIREVTRSDRGPFDERGSRLIAGPLSYKTAMAIAEAHNAALRSLAGKEDGNG